MHLYLTNFLFKETIKLCGVYMYIHFLIDQQITHTHKQIFKKIEFI